MKPIHGWTSPQEIADRTGLRLSKVLRILADDAEKEEGEEEQGLKSNK